MPKYLIKASYTAEGLKGLQKDKATGRRAAVATAVESLGGKLEVMYFSFGDHDLIAVADLPNNVCATALSLAASTAGLARVKTTTLLTAEEVDQALVKSVSYRAPGR